MNEQWIPITLFIVIGLTTAAYFYWNNRNRQSIMDTVQKAMDNGKELTPELLIQLGAAVNPKARDLRRGIVILFLGIATVLCKLGNTDRTCLTLAYSAGMSHSEISEIVDLPLGSVKSRIHRAKLKLQKWLEDHDHPIQNTRQTSAKEIHHAG